MGNAGKWWNNFSVQFRVHAIMATITRVITNIAKLMSRMILAGIIANIIVNSFYPEFSSRFPVIYSWFDGWLQFGEFLYKMALKGTYSLFTGQMKTFWTESFAEAGELWRQFLSWLSSIHF